MKLWIGRKRRDGKRKVTLGWDNGVRINKIFSDKQIEELKKKAEDVYHEIYNLPQQIRN